MGRSPTRPPCCIGASPAGTGSWPSPRASGRWAAQPALGWGGLQRHPPPDRCPFREDKDDFLFFLARAEREQTYWAEQVEPLLGDDVEVRGECDQEQKIDLLGRAAALLFPIQWPEPFGLVMTEAMACGTPVVAWGNGSVPEVVADGETGFVVSSVQEMAAAIDRVGDLDPHAMRARVKEQFSAEAMVAGYERIYQQVLAGGDEAARVLRS
jgi:glycosyltransferase involved in cell wall biosynthesis